MQNKSHNRVPSLVKLFSLEEKATKYLWLSVVLAVVLTFTAIIVAFQHYYIVPVGRSGYFSRETHVFFNLLYWWCWIFFLPLVYRITLHSGTVTTKLWYWVLFYFLVPLGFTLLHQTIAAGLLSGFMLKSAVYPVILQRILRNTWAWVDFVIYFIISSSIALIEFQERIRLNEMKITQMQSQLAQSQLNALKSQLRPHFLFNTLNSLSTLILKEDNPEAERMLSLLTSFLQTTVYAGERHEVALREELKFINEYLEIEKVRFKEKLEVREEIEEASLDVMIPGFLLQPVVENAIYHAIAPKLSGGVISILSRTVNNKLLLTIEDNGPGLRSSVKKKQKEGVGLRITKERLQQLYGDDYLLNIVDRAEGGVRVEIRIPIPFAPASKRQVPESATA